MLPQVPSQFLESLVSCGGEKHETNAGELPQLPAPTSVLHRQKWSRPCPVHGLMCHPSDIAFDFRPMLLTVQPSENSRSIRKSDHLSYRILDTTLNSVHKTLVFVFCFPNMSKSYTDLLVYPQTPTSWIKLNQVSWITIFCFARTALVLALVLQCLPFFFASEAARSV